MNTPATCGCPINAPEADPTIYKCPCGAHCPDCNVPNPPAFYVHTTCLELFGESPEPGTPAATYDAAILAARAVYLQAYRASPLREAYRDFRHAAYGDNGKRMVNGADPYTAALNAYHEAQKPEETALYEALRKAYQTYTDALDAQKKEGP